MDSSSLPDARAARDAEHYRTLLEINNAIIANLTRDALFHAIAGALQRVLPFDRTAIFLYETRRNVLRLFVLEASMPSTHFGVGLELAPDGSDVGWVFLTVARRIAEFEGRSALSTWIYRIT